MKQRWLFALCGVHAFFLIGCGGESEVSMPQPDSAAFYDNAFRECGSGFTAVPADAMPLRSDYSVVIMGSSSAAGAGASHYERSWAGLYTKKQQLSGNLVHNIARGGHTTYHALPDFCLVSAERFQPDPEHNLDQALLLEPDLVIISYPSNDAALGWSASESLSNILLLRSLLYERGIASIVVGAQPRQLNAARVIELERLNAQLKTQLDHCLVDVYADLVLNDALDPSYDYGDGVHLNNAGHQRVFERLSELVASERCVVAH